MDIANPLQTQQLIIEPVTIELAKSPDPQKFSAKELGQDKNYWTKNDSGKKEWVSKGWRSTNLANNKRVIKGVAWQPSGHGPNL